KGWGSRQEIYALSQLLELGGKRQKQVKIASYLYYAALTGYEATKLMRLSELTKNFIQVTAVQELLKIYLEQEKNAEEFLKLTHEKFEAGKISLIEHHKAELTKSLVELNLKKHFANFKTSKKSLSLSWASSNPDFDLVSYPFFDIQPPESLE